MVLFFFGEQLHAGQVRGLHQRLDRRLADLAQWKSRLAKPNSGPRSAKAAREQVAALLRGQYLKKVLRVHYYGRRKGDKRLRYGVDTEALEHLEREVFGKRLLITDRHE